MADGFNYGYQNISKAQNAAKPATSPFTNLFNGLLSRNFSKNNQATPSAPPANAQTVPYTQVPYEAAQYSYTMPPAYALPPPVYSAPAYTPVNPYAVNNSIAATAIPAAQTPLPEAAPARSAPKLGGLLDGIFKGNIMENWWVFIALFFILFPSAGKGFLGPK